MAKPAPRVAIVADWLTNMGGAEHLLYSLHKAFPDAPIYTSVFDLQKCKKFEGVDVRTTYLQRLPRFLRNKHQLFPVIRAHAFRHLDLSDYDIVISSASAEAKAVRVRENAVHISYCHTPTRYYWSHYKEYKKNPGMGALDPIIRLIIPPFVHWMRRLDLKAVKGVDYFIANSHEVQKRIKKYYRRDSTVIFPPVEVSRLKPKKAVKKEDYYLIVGRQIPYKRVDLAIRACNVLQRRLVVIGGGSEHEKLIKMAGPTIEFKTDVDDQQIVEYFQKARAFIFPSFEDFGIVPVEAMAAGTPVVAFGHGGALDYVDTKTSGIFFEEQTIQSLVDAIEKFEKRTFDGKKVMAHAEQFDESVFIAKMRDFVKRTVR